MLAENRVALITGAAGTLGRATAAAFARLGVRRILLDVSGPALAAAYSRDDDEQALATAIAPRTWSMLCADTGGCAGG